MSILRHIPMPNVTIGNLVIPGTSYEARGYDLVTADSYAEEGSSYMIRRNGTEIVLIVGNQRNYALIDLDTMREINPGQGEMRDLNSALAGSFDFLVKRDDKMLGTIVRPTTKPETKIQSVRATSKSDFKGGFNPIGEALRIALES